MTKTERKHGPRKRAASMVRSNAPFRDMIDALAAQLQDSRTDEALDRAQEKAFDAMEARGRRKRVALAREALAMSPLCADAYAVLGQEADSPEEALAFYRQAVKAGADALGEAAFEQDAGLFWGLIETRPYMRARHRLALALWKAGAGEEAVTHYEAMLRLNPNDNQGIRYSLMDALLMLGRDKEAAALWKRYEKDGSAAWTWSRALMIFRKGGDRPAARKALSKAITCNPHVPPYLSGRKPLPRQLPDFVGIGDEDEAVSYVHDALPAWSMTDGALAWGSAMTESPQQPARPGGGKPPTEASEALAERIDAAVLALLLLGLHDGDRAWKTFDWEAMDRLHAKGLISNPAGRTKSVRLTEAGLEAAREAQDALFRRDPVRRS